MAAAAAAVLGLWGTQACALSLGRLLVLSALGEPLRAEIDIPDINAEEAASLRTSVASSEAYRTAGMDYNALMSGLQISLQKRPDGRSYLRISSDRTVNDPYMDLILEASWSSGRIVRDYTMLFDPPNLRQAQAVTPTAPQVSSPAPAPAAVTPPPVAAPAPTASAPTAPAAAPSVSSSTSPRTTPAARPAAPVPPASKPPVAAQQQASAAASKRFTVKSGDNASKIAVANKLTGVSLDQMLVAMLRANPEAFLNGNINRIRAGVVISIPDAEQALATPAPEASQIVQAQSRDFSEYRSKLASSAPVSQVAGADRKAGGKVQAMVEDKKPAAAAPDKLTLAKGEVQGKAADADKIAKELSAKEAARRTEELSKNIADLSKLSAATAPAEPAPAVKAEPPQAATAPAATVPPAADSAPAKRPPPPIPAVAEPSLIDDLLDNPLMPAAAAGLVALLAALGFYRIRQRRKAAPMDSSFLESKLQPDSFFGASGGQRVDTHDGGVTGSSMVYSPSQLDAADDVDPVAEADVYLAYGRDMQAEEILKEALRTHPERLAIHQKLMEIYAKRRDLRNLEAIANEAHRLTGGEGLDWNRVCELGISVDPTNPLYQPGGQPISGPAAAVEAADDQPSTVAPEEASPGPTEAAPLASTPDLDLDLDFSLDEEPSSATPQVDPIAEPTDDTTAAPPEAPALDLNFDLPAESSTASDSLEFEAEEQPQTAAPAPEATPAPQTADGGMLEFDLGSLSLDLGAASEPLAEVSPEDPLATKLALAEEFSAIGDTDGARALIEEILAEASGDMKVKAQEALDKLS